MLGIIWIWQFNRWLFGPISIWDKFLIDMQILGFILGCLAIIALILYGECLINKNKTKKKNNSFPWGNYEPPEPKEGDDFKYAYYNPSNPSEPENPKEIIEHTHSELLDNLANEILEQIPPKNTPKK